MSWATATTDPIANRIDAIAAAHRDALVADPAVRRALAGLRAVRHPEAATAGASELLERIGGWVDVVELALVGAGAAGKADLRAGERIADVQRQLDHALAAALERAEPAWRAGWLTGLVHAEPQPAAGPSIEANLGAEGERERARWILGAVLERAGLAPWDGALDPGAVSRAPHGAVELGARTLVGDRPGEIVCARISPSRDDASPGAVDALGFSVETSPAFRGSTVESWLGRDPSAPERLHLAYGLVEDALAGAAPPDPKALRVGGLTGSPVPVLAFASRAGTWDAWCAMLERLNVPDAQFEDLPANLPALADRIAAALAAEPRWQLGRLGERSAQVRAWFARLSSALEELDLDARTRGWPLGRRAGRVESGALDVAMGDPDDAAAQCRTIAEELIPFFARPYQIALMGVFSSGKTLLINKLLLAMAGLPLAPYAPDPPYRADPRYVALKPYLRRSTAEPTDTVVTILRAPHEDDDPARVRDLLALIAKPRPSWPSDPVEIPVPLAELETMNLVDTPGLNEDLSVNRRVGAFLQSCDLIVYVFSATGVMNSQDHFLIRRLHDVAPRKRMIFAINMIDTLVNRVAHTAFWSGEHEKAVVKASLPLRTRIKQEVARITGEEPPLVLGEDFWVTSGAYDYQIEGLYRHLRALIERTAALDRLRATPGILRTHLRWARAFARVHLEDALRPRRAAVERAIAVLRTLFASELPRRMDEDKERSLAQFALRHALADPVFPAGPRAEPPTTAPEEPPAPWAPFRAGAPLALGKDGGAAALAETLEDGDTIGAWARALAATVLGQMGRDAWAHEVAGFDRALELAARAAQAAIGGAFEAFADALLPARVEAAGTALGREITRRCAALALELDVEYRSRWGTAFGEPGTPEEAAARALVGAMGTDVGQAGGNPLDGPQCALAAQVDAIATTLAAQSQDLAAELGAAPTWVEAAVAAATDRLRDGGSVRRALEAARVQRNDRRTLRGRVRLATAVGLALLLAVAVIAGGGAAIALVVLAVGGGACAWVWERGATRGGVARELADAAELQRAWDERLAAFEADLARLRADARTRAAGWAAAAARIGEVSLARGYALASDYRSRVRELFRSGSLAPWLASVDALAASRTLPLEALRERLVAAIAAAECAQRSFAIGELADEASALEVLARAHDRNARPRHSGRDASAEV